MQREVVAVDMDDVVVETAQAIVDHVNKTRDARMHINHFYSRDPAVWGAPNVETAVSWVNAYLETDEYFALPPIQEALHVLRGLKRVHELFILTGRPDFTEVATRKWLAEHTPDIFADVVFTNYFDTEKVRTKGDVCKALGATVLIDDHVEHCVSAMDNGVNALLFGSYPWNQTAKPVAGLQRVAGWSEIKRLLLPNAES